MLRKLTAVLFLFLLLNTAYITAFATPSIFYMANVVLHVFVGFALFVAFLFLMAKDRGRLRYTMPAAALFTVATIAAAYLTAFGDTRPHRWVLYAHVVSAVAGVLLLFPYVLANSRTGGGGWMRFRKAFVALVIFLFVFPAAAHLYQKKFPPADDFIGRPLTAPLAMTGEGAGPASPFWPSSSRTNTGRIIPSNFFMDSDQCGECHKDIYRQWKSSMHHFASFNNQYYRKSIEYMQDVQGTTKGSKWCAGCHDHAVFFNGRFDRPIKEQIDAPEAQNGLGCMSCHAITALHSTMGNADFTVTYPPLHELASSTNPLLHATDKFLTYLDPEPHRRTFLKPFMKHNAEFCSACHKVHLDVPVNNYRWVRGFNDYDNWQASGVSGQGARSFYYPPKSLVCADCHMPLVPSSDPGNINGMVHSHRFPAANTAVAYVNKDAEQLKAEQDFLKSGFITVDIFAASPVDPHTGELQMRRRASDTPKLNSTFGVGEESEQTGETFIREVGKISAPINKANAVFQPGSTVRVDTVVRTRAIGHFFPGGTVDAFDIWLEMEGRDAAGRAIFWSGFVEDNGRGPVEPGAHFYKSYQLDEDGNAINKRNAWSQRSVLYVHLIPPGAADVVHYRIHIPAGARGPITLTARLNYRKFSHYFNQFAYAGQPKPGQPASLVSRSFDNRQFSFDPANIPANVSGQFRGEIPSIPITTLATATAKLQLGDQRTETKWEPVVRKGDRERWNDWGIGMLLQGDLKGAEYAFRKVTEAEPGYADGWLNVARALIQEGETDAAKPFVEKAMAINPHLGRVYYFKALAQKADGDYDGAVQSLGVTASLYPRDRVVQDQIGRILFLKRQYAQAIKAFEATLAVDPEDLQAHYNLMLCYRGLGDLAGVEREQTLFLRFKANEAAQSITQKPRILSPEDNNERQPIHDHENALPDRGAGPRPGRPLGRASQAARKRRDISGAAPAE
ncbi:MAG: tetratricopeptide repeat protein [Bryobacteraceae bacterium]